MLVNYQQSAKMGGVMQKFDIIINASILYMRVKKENQFNKKAEKITQYYLDCVIFVAIKKRFFLLMQEL